MAASQPAHTDAPHLRTPDPERSPHAGFDDSYFGAVERGEYVSGGCRALPCGRSDEFVVGWERCRSGWRVDGI